MQELEKILEEIEHLEKIQFSSYTKPLITIEDVEKIIRKHMTDGWIPVEERMPERTPDEKINNSYKKYLVFIDNIDYWDIDIAVYDLWNDKKWREFSNRIARLKMLQLGALFQIHTRKYRRKINDKGNS